MAPDSEDQLQFDEAEFTGETDGPRKCAGCDRELLGEYYTAGDGLVCTECYRQLRSAEGAGFAPVGLLRAVLFGGLGGAVGAGVYFAILKLTGYEIGLVAIVVGGLVGAGVRLGAAGRGGWVYQTLAVALTYTAIVGTYVPFITQAIVTPFEGENGQTARVVIFPDDSVQLNGRAVSLAEATSTMDRFDENGVVWYHRVNWDEPPGASADSVAAAVERNGLYVFTFQDREFRVPDTFATRHAGSGFVDRLVSWARVWSLAYQAPFVDAAGNIIGILIIGFAVYQAWTMNRRRKIELAGPFAISQLSSGFRSGSSPGAAGGPVAGD